MSSKSLKPNERLQSFHQDFCRVTSTGQQITKHIAGEKC